MRVASNKLKDMIGFYHTELSGIYDSGEIEALLALAVEYYLGFSRTDLITKGESNMNQSDLLKLYDCCKALKTGSPIQYLLGEVWFYDLKFKVNPSVLIPRPETEELVDLVISENKQAASFLDVATGSGCIPISIKKNIPVAKVLACDISSGALEVAAANCKLNQLDVTLFETDVLDAAAFYKTVPQPVEVIISNPPYVKADEKKSMLPLVVDHEPHLALFVEGKDDIIFYKHIIDLCTSRLDSNGRLYFELNPLTAESVKTYALDSHLFQQVEILKDLSGKNRFLKAVAKK